MSDPTPPQTAPESVFHPKPATRVMIIDDHRLMQLGVKSLLSDEPDLYVCGGAESAEDALRLIPEVKPDVAICDISIKGEIDGVTLAKMISQQFPNIAILMLSMHEESAYAQRALDAGASGYLNKADAPQLLVNALRCVLAGELFYSPTSFSSEVRLKISASGKRIVRPGIGGVTGPFPDSF